MLAKSTGKGAGQLLAARPPSTPMPTPVKPRIRLKAGDGKISEAPTQPRETPPTYRSGASLGPEFVFRPPPPVSPARPFVRSGAAKPAQNAPRLRGTGIWLLLGFLFGIGLLAGAISTLKAPSNVSVYGALEPGSGPVEVRRALPADTGSPAGIGTQRMITMPDGSTVWTTFKGYLTDVSQLPIDGGQRGRYVGDRRQLLDSDNSAGFFPTGLGRPAR
jgi:hypothetical protein